MANLLTKSLSDMFPAGEGSPVAPPRMTAYRPRDTEHGNSPFGIEAPLVQGARTGIITSLAVGNELAAATREAKTRARQDIN